MTKYLVELTGNVEGITAEGWKAMMKVVDDYKVGIENVYKVNGEEKETCEWIQGRLAAYKKDGENAKVHKVKSYENKVKATKAIKRELTPVEKAFKCLKKNGIVKIMGFENNKEIYEQLKAMCKEKKVAASGKFCNTYYKVVLK